MKWDVFFVILLCFSLTQELTCFVNEEYNEIATSTSIFEDKSFALLPEINFPPFLSHTTDIKGENSITSIPYQQNGTPLYFYVYGNYGYQVIKNTDGSNVYSRFEIYDLSDLSNPTLLGHYDYEAGANYKTGFIVSEDGNFAYLALYYTGLTIIDISDKSNPQEIATLSGTVQDRIHVGMNNTVAFLFRRNEVQGLYAINITDPQNPIQIDSYLTSSIGSNGHGYSEEKQLVAYGWRTLAIFDVSNPASISLLSTISSPSGTKIQRLVFGGDFIYTIDGTYLQIIDITNPSFPIYKGSIKHSIEGKSFTENNFFGGALLHLIDNKFICVVSYDGEDLTIINVEDAENPYIYHYFTLAQSGLGTANGYHIDQNFLLYLTSQIDKSTTIFDLNCFNSITISGDCKYGSVEFLVSGCSNDECESQTVAIEGTCRNSDYHGDNCTLVMCDGILSNETTKVCSNLGEVLGECISPEKCNCLYGEASATTCIPCVTGTTLFFDSCVDSFILFGIIGIGGASIVFVLIILIVITISIVIISILYKKSNRFAHIQNLDMIVKEAEIEQKSIAKLSKSVTGTKSGYTPRIKTSNADWIINFEEIKLLKLIGDGGSETSIYKAEWNGQIVAYKGFHQSLFGDFTDDNVDCFEREVAVCIKLSHPSIVQFYGACIQFPKFGLVTMFCQNGDIPNFFFQYEKLNQGKKYPMKERIRIIFEIISGMEYLHKKEIMHRDLKPENILIDDQEKSKITDFGLSKIAENAEKTMTRQVGTSFYRAPEVLNGDKYSKSCDVYSFAYLVLFIISGKSAFKENTNTSIKLQTDKNYRPNINELDFKGCEYLIEIIKKCWAFDPEERYSFSDLKIFLKKNVQQTK